MTPLFCCGFECGVSGTNTHIALSSGAFSFSTSTKRTGQRSLRCNPAGTQAWAQTPSITGTTQRKVGRVYIYFASLPSADCTVLQNGGDDAGPKIRFKQSDSKLYAAVGTTLGASGVTVTTGQWYRLDFHWNSPAGTDTSDLQVDGTACGQASATGTSGVSGTVRIGVPENSVNADVFYDDLIFGATQADYPIGPGRVDHFVPTADGAHNVAGANDFERTTTGTDIINSTTTAFQLIDDVPLESGASVDWINMIAPPNATDYVECIFGPAPGVSSPASAPRAVEIIAGYHQAATGTGNMEIRINDNGTLDVLYTATGVAGVTSVAYARKFYGTAIAGGGAWVIGGGGNGDFTDLRVRFGSPAALDVNPDQYFDCIMVEAEFADGTQFTQSASGTLTTAGALSKQGGKVTAATLTTAGALTKETRRALTGTLASLGALIKRTDRALTAALTTAGDLAAVRTVQVALTATLTTAGALVREGRKVLDATLSTAGTLTKQTSTSVAGTLSTSGALTRQAVKVLAGTVTTAGELAAVAQKTLAGTLSTAGALTKQTARALASTLSTSGALTSQASKVLAGTLTAAGAVTNQTARALVGTLSTTGALAGQARKSLDGTLTAAGALTKRTARALTATLTTAGALVGQLISGGTTFFQSLAATLTVSGSLSRQTQTEKTASLSASGTLTRLTALTLSGTLAPVGTLAKMTARALSGAFSFIGALVGLIVDLGPSAQPDVDVIMCADVSEVMMQADVDVVIMRPDTEVRFL